MLSNLTVRKHDWNVVESHYKSIFALNNVNGNAFTGSVPNEYYLCSERSVQLEDDQLC